MSTTAPAGPPPSDVVEAATFGFAAPTAASAMTAAAALRAADELGVWDALAEAPGTPVDVAERLGLDAAGVAVLLRVLVGLGIAVHRADGRYASTVAAASYRAVARGCEALAPSVRARRRTALPDYAGVVDVLADGLAAASLGVGATLGSPRTVLDLGAGAAPHTRALALDDPDVRVTLVDRAEVLEVARRRVVADGLDGQFAYLAGDVFTVLLPSEQDAVLLSGVLHLYDDVACRALVRRAADALRPGGRLAIVEPLPDESLDGPLDVALYAVGLYLRAPEGGVRPFSTYAAWLAAAGLARVDRHGTARPGLAVVTAQRPR